MKNATLRELAGVLTPEEQHWVGDGFLVSTIFSPFQIKAEAVSPFILMDHAAPRHFGPSSQPRGVGPHPHRGFETVTIAYAGEIEHRDSHGGGGIIGAGGVQWMTAGSGVVHEEFQSSRFTQTGGSFEMIQLWVNLPARLKMTTPRYQAFEDSDFPRIDVGDGTARVIAGNYDGALGPAEVHTPITMFDLTFPGLGSATVVFPDGYTTLVFALRGSARVQGHTAIPNRGLAVFPAESTGEIKIDALEADTTLLFLAGEPLGEPVVQHGPFVMNHRDEINQAIRDYQLGLMGGLKPKQ